MNFKVALYYGKYIVYLRCNPFNKYLILITLDGTPITYHICDKKRAIELLEHEISHILNKGK